MQITADFHIHSRYSRATSRDMDIPTISRWAGLKGLNLLGTGDFTHPLWLEELKRYLQPAGDGAYAHAGVHYLLTAEVSNIYHRRGRLRKVHNLIFAPSIETAEKINRALTRYGKLLSDGRPILSLDCQDMVKLVLDISPRCLIVPAHAWTPHFSVFGSNSGFNSLEECFGRETDNIHAIETGLASDPQMNWRVSGLDYISLLSNSNAHTPKDLGREANVFEIADAGNLYNETASLLREKDNRKFLYTIEFFPEEGKYHLDGHRGCSVRMTPKESRACEDICPKCGRKVTTGVLHRLEEIADRDDRYRPQDAVPFKSLIPLDDILADALGAGKGSSNVEKEYLNLVKLLGSEFNILINIPEEELYRNVSRKIADGILKVRRGELDLAPGYDGVYGSVAIRWAGKAAEQKINQLSLF